jgi:transposase
MCDCCAEEGQPPGHEETRQRLSFKSRRFHRGLLRADLSAHDITIISAAVPAAFGGK